MWLQYCCFSKTSGWMGLTLAKSSRRTPSFSQRVWKTWRPGNGDFWYFLKTVFSPQSHVMWENISFLERVNYLKSKKFSPETVASMVSKAPYLLNFSVKRLDNRLGFFQQQLSLSAPNVSIWNWLMIFFFFCTFRVLTVLLVVSLDTEHCGSST